MLQNLQVLLPPNPQGARSRWPEEGRPEELVFYSYSKIARALEEHFHAHSEETAVDEDDLLEFLTTGERIDLRIYEISLREYAVMHCNNTVINDRRIVGVDPIDANLDVTFYLRDVTPEEEDDDEYIPSAGSSSGSD